MTGNFKLEKIAKAEIKMDPFPHFTISNFFDAEFLANLRKDFPRSEIESSKMTSKSRFTMLHRTESFLSLIESSVYWRELYESISSTMFENLIRRKYNETQDFAGLGDPVEIDLSSQMDITFARDGYKRGVHLDRGHHFFNSFIYLNGHDEFGGTGGELQLHSVKNVEGAYDKFPDSSSVLSSKKIKVEENMFVGFFCCPWSYHSVVPMEGSTGTRDFVYCALNEASERDLWPAATVHSQERRGAFLAE